MKSVLLKPSRGSSMSIFGFMWKAACLVALIWLMHLCAVAAPVNDNFENATVLPPSWTAVGGNNTAATFQSGEPSHSPSQPAGGRSVWWKWTPNFSGQVKITTEGSTSTTSSDGFLDTQLAVYVGNSVSALSAVVKNEDHPDFMHGWSRVDFTASSGTTYYIAVDGFDGNTGTIKLNFAFTGPAPKYSLTVNVIPGGAGTVILDPPQPSGGYDAGTVVTLSASANGGTFSSWGGSASGSSSTVNVTMNGSKSVSAIFNSNHKLVLMNNNSRALAAWLLQGSTFLGATSIRNGQPLAPGWRIVGSADFDNNGSSDLLIQNDDGRLAVWYFTGTSQTGAGLIRNGTPAAAGWKAVGAADFDGNGSGDILFQNSSSGSLAVWLLSGTSFVGGAAIRSGQSPGAGWRAVGAADISGNGKPDIVFHSSGGQVMVWLLNGTAYVDSVVLRGGATTPTSWKLIALPNLNGDAYADLLWQNSNGAMAAWYMSGTTFGSSTSIRSGWPATGWTAVGAD